MRDKFRALLEIESGEESMVSMLLTQSVFLGVFIGAFDITAYSLLLSTFDEKLMARGYILSGIAGIILTSVYLKLRTKIRFGKLAVINLVFITAITLSLWAALSISTEKWIIFLVFVMLGPLNILAFMSFWGTSDRLFGEPKKLFSFLETGLKLGVMVISFTIPVLISFKLQTSDILLPCLACLTVAILIQININNKFTLRSIDDDDFRENTLKRLPLVIQKDSFKRQLGVFAALSVLTAFLIQYSLMGTARKLFTVSEEMAVFLGLFTASLIIFNLIVKYAVFPFILNNFGVKTCLFVSPLVIAVVSAIAVVSGLSLGNLPVITSGYFLLILILGFNRIISKSFKDSVEIPSFRIIYQSLSRKLKPEIQSGVDGTVNEMGLIFSGIILTAFGFLNFIKLIHFSFLLLIVSIMWIIVGRRLIREYRLSLTKVTEEESQQVDVPDNVNIPENRFSASIELRKDYLGIISGNFSDFKKIRNQWYSEELFRQALTKKDLNLLPMLRKAAANNSLDINLRKRSLEVAEVLEKKPVSSGKDNGLEEGIRVLSGARMPQTTEILRLLRNKPVESKRVAIYMIGKFRISDLLSVVCESLNTPGLAHDAYEVLASFGPDAGEDLMRYYLINSGNTRLSRMILLLLGNTCTREATGFMFSRLRSNSRQLKEISVKCLLGCKFKPTEEEKIYLDHLASEVTGIITWNLSVKVILERERNESLLNNINRETERWESFLFDILTINYGPSAEVIRQNIREKTVESVGHATELIKVVVSESIRPQLICLLSNMSDKNKLKRLFQFYPGEAADHRNLTDELINRDYNLISLWTKASALRSINKIADNELAESVKALLFSPEDIIQEEATNLIARTDPDLYRSVSQRIPGGIKHKLDEIVNGKNERRELLFEKVQFLSKHFTGLPEDDLLPLAHELKFIRNSGSLSSSEGFMIWLLDENNSVVNVDVHYEGDSEPLKFSKISPDIYYLSLDAVEEFHYQYTGKSYEILKYIDNHQKINKNKITQDQLR